VPGETPSCAPDRNKFLRLTLQLPDEAEDMGNTDDMDIQPAPPTDEPPTEPDQNEQQLYVLAGSLGGKPRPGAEGTAEEDVSQHRVNLENLEKLKPASASAAIGSATTSCPQIEDRADDRMATDRILRMVAGIRPTATAAKVTGKSSTKVQTENEGTRPKELNTMRGHDTLALIARYAFTGHKVGPLFQWSRDHAQSMTMDRIQTAVTVMNLVRWKLTDMFSGFLTSEAADACIVGALGRAMEECPTPVSPMDTTEPPEFLDLSHNAPGSPLDKASLEPETRESAPEDELEDVMGKFSEGPEDETQEQFDVIKYMQRQREIEAIRKTSKVYGVDEVFLRDMLDKHVHTQYGTERKFLLTAVGTKAEQKFDARTPGRRSHQGRSQETRPTGGEDGARGKPEE
jgi:hypothetical protein